MEQSKLLKISWIIYAIAVILGMVMSAVNLISSRDFFCAAPYEANTGQSWTELVAEHPKQATLYESFCRGGACAWLSGSIYALYITLTAYRKGEKRAWIILLLGAILATGGPLVMSVIRAGDATPWWTFWLCFDLVVLLLPVKDFLSQKAPPATEG
jgi:formate/nitrite transporter FocA (FNT family)